MPLVLDQITSEGLVDLKSFRSQIAVTTASASTLSLTVASELVQIIAGTVAGQIVKLPDATTLTPGWRYEVWNASSQNLTLQDNSSAAVGGLIAPNQRAYLILQAAGSAAGTWLLAVAEKTPQSTEQFLVTYSGTGLAVNYTAGVARFNGVFTNVAAGTLTLGTSITNGWIYVDIDGTVKSGATPPNNVVPLYTFTTSASAVTALLDEREDIDQNLVWGVVGDIVSNTYNRAASAGTLEKYARADHAHANNQLLNKSGVVAAATFAGNPKKATITFTAAMPSATYAIKMSSGDGRTVTYENRTTTGFVINLNANAAPTNDVSWEATIVGEAS